MKTQENIRLFKEQLRQKSEQLKKLDLEKKRQEKKIDLILKNHGLKVGQLETEIEEKKEEVEYHQSISQSLRQSRHQKIKKEEESPSKNGGEAALDKKQVKKIKGLLVSLKKKNEALTVKIKDYEKDKESLVRDKNELHEKINSIKENESSKPISSDLKNKVHQIEEKSQRSIKHYQSLLEDKEKVIQSYEELIEQNRTKAESHPEALKLKRLFDEAKIQIDRLTKEKNGFKKKLNATRKRFGIDLKEEIEELENAFKSRLKKIRGDFKRQASSFDEIAEDGSAPAWMSTYADMTTLLLTFFILYYSMTSSTLGRIKEAIQGSSSKGFEELLENLENQGSLEEITGIQDDSLQNDLENLENDVQIPSSTETQKDNDIIIIRIPGQTLFESGTADLKLKESRKILDEIVQLVKKYSEYKINIQGHTDDQPITSSRYPSNWELSASRATSVLRYFIDKNIEPQRLTATGFADLFPIVDNRSEQGRSFNRRVEFVLEKEK